MRGCKPTKMKKLLLTALILSTPIFANAQTTTEEFSGVYAVTYQTTNSLIVDTLTLNTDGTFVFHEYDKHDNGLPPERNKYAKGTWRADKKLIYFFADKTDFDEKHTLDFNSTKARFIDKSLKDKSNRDIKISIRFYESDIFWITGRTLLKIE